MLYEVITDGEFSAALLCFELLVFVDVAVGYVRAAESVERNVALQDLASPLFVSAFAVEIRQLAIQRDELIISVSLAIDVRQQLVVLGRPIELEGSLGERLGALV